MASLSYVCKNLQLLIFAETLLTYATSLAFYVHLAALPPASRPDFSTHPILPRLLQLKEGVTMLEDLDFAAGSESVDLLLTTEDMEDEEEGSTGGRELVGLLGDEEEDDADDLWQKEGLEDGELEELMADAENEQMNAITSPKSGKEKKKRRNKVKKASSSTPKASGGYQPLVEPVFFSAKKAAPASIEYDDDDSLGDPTSLTEADAIDKERRVRSLRFHTSKIAATSARRSAARTQRLGGDEDLPYRDRKAARNAALRKNGPEASGGEVLEPVSKGDKRVRMQEDEDGGGYYDLVKRRCTEEKVAKEAEHDAVQAARLYVTYPNLLLTYLSSAHDNDAPASGPRALTRAIEKNRGLTPRRSKTGRNPRVKKRQAYEKAKQKVASQRAVFKGGQASLDGAYRGEKTGISTAVKSRRF